MSVVYQLSSVSQTEEELISAVSLTEGNQCLLSFNCLLSPKLKETYVYCLSHPMKFISTVSQTEENLFLLSLKPKESYVYCLCCPVFCLWS